MITHVPFWERGDGAQQRMFSLHRFLSARGVRLTVFFLRETDDAEKQELGAQGINLVSFEPPTEASSSLRKMLANWLSRIAGTSDAPKTNDSSLTPDQFRWDTAATQFEHLIAQNRPDLLIVEYVALAPYINDIVTSQCGAVILDTHDVMHLRRERFDKQNQPHWLDIDREQESRLFGRFDMLLAIQEQEAALIQEMCPDSEVIVAGHCPIVAGPPPDSLADDADEAVTIGFLGSDNVPNRDGIDWFLSNVWPRVADRCREKVRLLLAGGFTAREPYAGLAGHQVECWSQQIDVQRFYRRAEIVINPVSLGTGLKIKSVEALAFGRPLVTTSHSSIGLPSRLLEWVDVTDDAEQFTDFLVSLAMDRDLRNSRTRRIRQLAAQEFSESAVYAAFEKWLQRYFSNAPNRAGS